MTQLRSPATTWHWLGSLLGVLAGLWGATVILIFAVSLSRMIEPGAPYEIIWSIDGPAFVVLGLQLVAYAACGTIALLAGIDRVRNRNWLRFMLLLSLAFLGLSVIPFSTIGPIILPAAVAALAGSLLLLATAAKAKGNPAARRTNAP